MDLLAAFPYIVPALACAAMISDLKTGKIKNIICILGFAAGIGLRIGFFTIVAAAGADLFGFFAYCALFWKIIARALLDSLLGAAIPFVLLFLPFHFRMIGAGDIKLLMAIGSITGAAESAKILIASLACGAVISLMIMVFVTGIRPRFQYFVQYVRMTEMTGVIRPYRDAKEAEFHFTVPVFMAALLFAARVI